MSKRSPGFVEVLRLWGASWQRWRRAVSSPEAPWEMVQQTIDLSGVWAEVPVVVLPARTVCSGATWVPETDLANALESARLLAEAAGWIHSSTAEEQIEVSLLSRTQDTSLVRTLVYPADFTVPAGKEVTAFVPSPLALDLPPRALCAWREGAFFVLVLTGDSGPILWEARVEEPGTVGWDGWVQAFLMEAEAEGHGVHGIHAVDYEGQVPWCLPGGAPVQAEPSLTGPPPKIPITPIAWAPPAVLAARHAQKRRRTFMRLAAMGSALLAVVALACAGYLLTLRWQLDALREEVEAASLDATPAIRTARQWEAVATSILPTHFALEHLLLSVEALPPDGVRLSVFQSTPEGVRIEGDARNVGLATLYFNNLQAQPAAQNFAWEMGSPALQPDNSARFAIDGTRLPPP